MTEWPKQFLVTVTPMETSEVSRPAATVPVSLSRTEDSPAPDPKVLLHLMSTYFVELRKRLYKHEITAADLAEEAGIAPTQLSRWMRGKVDARMSSIENLERAFETMVARKKRRG